jgi:hypothetical protein
MTIHVAPSNAKLKNKITPKKASTNENGNSVK